MKPWDAISTILKEMALAAVPGARTIDIDAYAEKRIKEPVSYTHLDVYKRQKDDSVIIT